MTVRGAQVHNNGPRRTIVPEGSLVHGSQTIPLAFRRSSLASGASARATATAHRVRRPALWSPAAPNLYQLELAVGNESSYSARVGLRQLSWQGGRPVPQRHPPAAPRRDDPGGRAGARRRAHPGRPGRDRRRAEGDRRERGARAAPARPGPARTAGRGGDPRLAGRRARWKARATGIRRTPRLTRGSRAAGAHGGARGRAAPVDLRLEPRRRGRRQRPRRG